MRVRDRDLSLESPSVGNNILLLESEARRCNLSGVRWGVLSGHRNVLYSPFGKEPIKRERSVDGAATNPSTRNPPGKLDQGYNAILAIGMGKLVRAWPRGDRTQKGNPAEGSLTVTISMVPPASSVKTCSQSCA